MALKLAYTAVEDIPKLHAEVRAAYSTGRTRSIAYRKEQLAQLAYMIKDNQDRFKAAIKADLGRPEIESDLLDIVSALTEVKDAYDNVEKWAKTEKAPWDFNWFAMKPAIRKEPKGMVLVISPFNFPLFLSLGHMAGVIAAGNAVVLKPSELIPATDILMAELFPKYLDSDVYKIVNGDVPVTTKLLEMRWDHILYTGNGRVAKIVLTAAAKHLTPVTTELGGKNPVIIDPKCDMMLAARRVLWGRFANAGQVCVSPDYVLVPRNAQDLFISACEKVYQDFYPDGNPENSDSLGRIVSEAHTARIKRYIDETQGKIVFGGVAKVEKKFVAPTLVRDVPPEDSLMEEEIFGPVLPIVPVNDVDEAIEYVNARDQPLALYVFTQDAALKAKVFEKTQSGAAIANEVTIQVGTHGMPFGGIGASGSGCLTGKYAFDTFTHRRGTLDNPAWVDTLVLNGRYPPYTANKAKKLNKAFAISMPPRPGQKPRIRWSLWLLVAFVGLLLAVLTKRQRS